MDSITGSVTDVTTYADGHTEVTVANDDSSETFYHPKEMTDDQLDEFKRAQNNGLDTGVAWKTDEQSDTRKVVFVKVMPPSQ